MRRVPGKGEAASYMPVTIVDNQKLHAVDLRRVRRGLTRLLKESHCEDKTVVLLLVDDQEIRRLNAAYLSRDRATNVLSFAMREGEFGNVNPHILGDIVVSVETAYRDAANGCIDPGDELEFLVIHGLLHLLGYEHEQTAQKKAREMRARERELFFLLRGYYPDRG